MNKSRKKKIWAGGISMLFGLVIISSFVLPTKASSASVSFGQETYEVSNGQEFQVEVKLTA